MAGIIKNTGKERFFEASTQAALAGYATTAYVDNAIIGLLDDRGDYDASTNLFPAAGGSGTAGAVLKGDIWRISVAGTLGTITVSIGDWVRALSDAPGQTASNWSIAEGVLTAAGSSTYVQYNTSGQLAAASTFTYDSATDLLTAGTSNFKATTGIFDSTNRLIKYSTTVTAMNFDTFTLYDTQATQKISIDFTNRTLKDAAEATTVNWSQTFLQLHGSNADLDVTGTMANNLRIAGDPDGTVGNGLYLKAYNGATWRSGLRYLNVGAGEPILALLPDSVGTVTIGGIITSGTWNGASISTTYTDAKIKGVIAATAGLIPFGTGTADTVTSSADLKYSTSAGFYTNGFSGGGGMCVREWVGVGAGYGAVYLGSTAAVTPSVSNYSLAAAGTSTILNGGTAVSLYIAGSNGASNYIWDAAVAAFNIRQSTTISGILTITRTTEQLRIAYDVSNYYSTTVGSTGAVTFNAVGAGSAFIFSDPVSATTLKATTAAGYISSDGSTGATGSFTTTDLKTVTVKDGIITSIV